MGYHGSLGTQTWLAGRSPREMQLIDGKIMYTRWIFLAAMFDYWRVSSIKNPLQNPEGKIIQNAGLPGREMDV